MVYNSVSKYCGHIHLKKCSVNNATACGHNFFVCFLFNVLPKLLYFGIGILKGFFYKKVDV